LKIRETFQLFTLEATLILYVISPEIEQDFNNKFRLDILNILRKGPVEKKYVPSLLTSFQITKPLILGGRSIKDEEIQDDEFIKDSSNLVKLEEAYIDYLSDQAKERLGGENNIKKFLKNLENKGIIISYKIIHKFAHFKCRFYITLSYCEPSSIDIIRNDKNLLKKIIDLYEITSHKDNVDVFDIHTTYLIIGEFSNLDDYHKWKEQLYDLLKNTNTINVFSFPVEGTLQEGAHYISNFPRFYDVCHSYAIGLADAKIQIGNPIFRGEESIADLPIYLNLNVLNHHGLILGEPGTGKTWTMWLLAKQILDKGKTVHIIDPTGGAREKIEWFLKVGMLKEQYIRENIETIDFLRFKNEINELPTGKIFIYKINVENIKKELPELFDKFKFLIEKREGSTQKERYIDNVVFFEEAHELFTLHKSYIDTASSLLVNAERKGVSVWLSLHSPSQLSRSDASNDFMFICKHLKNRIVHKISETDIQVVFDLLLKPELEEDYFYDMLKELSEIPKPLYAFIKIKTNGNNYLSPLKIKISSQFPEGTK
jgi:hypothetical protein